MELNLLPSFCVSSVLLPGAISRNLTLMNKITIVGYNACMFSLNTRAAHSLHIPHDDMEKVAVRLSLMSRFS